MITMTTTIDNNTPEISRINEFRGKEALQVYAEGISRELIDDKCGVYIWQPDGNASETTPFEAKFPEQPPEGSAFIPFDAVYNQVGYTAPSKSVKKGVAIVWVENKCGISKPFRVNQPRIFNQSRIKAATNELVQFFGSSMYGPKREYNGGQDITLLLYNPDNKEKYYIMNVCDAAYAYNKDQYISEFVIPDNVPNGKYKAYLHNGSGGVFGWSESVDLEIDSMNTLIDYCANKCLNTATQCMLQPKCKTIIIRPDDNGAEIDMSPKIQEAIDSLENGGIVKLTPGIYGIAKGIIVRNGVVIRGAGKNNTIIRTCDGKKFVDDWSQVIYASRRHGLHRWANDWRPLHESRKSAALIRLTENCGIEDIGVEFGNGANIGVLVANINSAESKKIFVNEVSVSSTYKISYSDVAKISDAICIGLLSVVSTQDMTIYNSEFKAVSPLQILPARNRRLKLIHNRIECSPAQIGESFVCGIRNSIISGNSFLNGRRSLLMQDGCSNNFIYQNRSFGVARAENAQEQYMSEYGHGIWHGCSVDNGTDYITIPDVDKLNAKETISELIDEYDLYVCILDGRGFGQYRAVVGNDGDKLLLDRAWDVIPDDNTFLCVLKATANNIFLNNNSEDGNGPCNFVWGSGLDNVICGHMAVLSYAMTLHAYSCGASDPEFKRNKCEYGVAAFNRFIGCQVKASGMGIRTDSSGPNLQVKDEFFDRYMRHHGVIGTVVTGNAFEGSKGQCYLKNQNSWMEETYNSGIELGGAYNLVQYNYIAGYANAVRMRYDCEGNYFAKNKFLYCDNNFVFESKHNYYAYDDGRISGPDTDKMWFLE